MNTSPIKNPYKVPQTTPHQSDNDNCFSKANFIIQDLRKKATALRQSIVCSEGNLSDSKSLLQPLKRKLEEGASQLEERADLLSSLSKGGPASQLASLIANLSERQASLSTGRTQYKRLPSLQKPPLMPK